MTIFGQINISLITLF